MASVQAYSGPETYVLTGGSDVSVMNSPDDLMEARLNGNQVYLSPDNSASTLDPPIRFPASIRDVLRVLAYDYWGGAYGITPVWLFCEKNGRGVQLDPGIPRTPSNWGQGYHLFFDKEFAIPDLCGLRPSLQAEAGTDQTVNEGKLVSFDGSGSKGSFFESEWNIQDVDTAGTVGHDPSLALDAAGSAHISYRDVTAVYYLKYARWVGSHWDIKVVDTVGSDGFGTSIALDANGFAHISYHDSNVGSLKYARWTGSSWNIETVDSAVGVGLYSSIELDGSGYPHISYYDSANEDLKYAGWTCGSWDIETVDSAGSVGLWTSLTLDKSGHAHISYTDWTNLDLKYARMTASGWAIEIVDSADVGKFTSIALDGNDYAHMSYYQSTGDDLKYARWTGASWSVETVDTAGYVGWTTSVAVDSEDRAHISYYDLTNWAIKYARWTGVDWSIETMDSAGPGYTSIALDSADCPNLAYFHEPGSDLRYARRSCGRADIVSYEWDFTSDGTYDYMETPASALDGAFDGKTTHIFGDDGAYTATLRVTDDSPTPTSRQLTSEPGRDMQPAWNADGTRVAYSSDSAGNLDIWVMDADGTNKTQLTTNTADDVQPHWSPDGKKTIFVSSRTSPVADHYEIFVMDSDGTNQTQLTFFYPSQGQFPRYSPDGSKIAYSFVNESNHAWEIWVMDSDGGGKTKLISGQYWVIHYFAPIWSHDGTTVLYSSMDQYGIPFDIYRMNSDGTDPQRILDLGGHERAAGWMGNKVAFYSDFTGDFELWSMNDDGTRPRQLTTDAGLSADAWIGADVSPDEKRIVFDSKKSGNLDLWMLELTGASDTDTVNVTVLNSAPTIAAASVYASSNVTLRVAGEKWHDVSVYAVDIGSETLVARLVREPGKPQETSFEVTIDVTENSSLRIAYTPEDDPVNGQPNGATPAWLTFAFDSGPPVSMHHTFNVKQPETWNWTVSLNSLLAGRDITFTAIAADPGSDDLTFTREWGDGSPPTATTYFNDGIEPDPYPSPGGMFPFTATDMQTHVYTMPGTYSIALRVTDDDGGVKEIMLVIIIV